MANERVIAVWPDSFWCDVAEVESHKHRSDDYRRITVHARMEDTDVDPLAQMAANGAPDEAITSEVVYWMGG